MADKITTISNLQDYFSHYVGAVVVEAFSVDAGPRGTKCFFGSIEYHAGSKFIEVKFDGSKVRSTYEVLDWLVDHVAEIDGDVDIAGLKLLFHGKRYPYTEIRYVLDRVNVATHVAEDQAMRALAATSKEVED